jgi:hypothetical protein
MWFGAIVMFLLLGLCFWIVDYVLDGPEIVLAFLGFGLFVGVVIVFGTMVGNTHQPPENDK